MNWIYALTLTLFSLSLFSQTTAEPLKISAAYLPENMEKSEKGITKGREVDILNLIFECMGEKAQFDIQPYCRHVRSFQNNDEYDGVVTVPLSEKAVGHKTDVYIRYHNGVIVRSNEFPAKVTSLKQLKGKHIIGFIGAQDLLRGLPKLVPSLASYNESGPQYLHNEMLMRKRIDAVISDGLIFMAHQKRLLEKEPEWKDTKIKFYGLFKATPFYAVFKKKANAQKFNACLLKLNKSGRLDAIESSYTEKYENSLGKEYLKPLLRSSQNLLKD